MGFCRQRHLGRPVRGSRVLPVAALAGLAALGLDIRIAQAQGHPDAGVSQRSGGAGASTLKSIPNPGLLSEGVRASLRERAAARHPSEIAAQASAAAAQPTSSPASAAAQSTRHPPSSEPLRRGLAQQRRVQALDTGNGITVLSNRVIEPPAPRLASLARAAAGEAEHSVFEPEEQASNDESQVTETRSLRALSSRRDVPKARERSLGLDWLLWPFVLLLATGAVVGTLWFSKKTE